MSPYALTKKTNEEYAKLYKELYNLDTYGFRCFNVFGRRQNPEGTYAAVIPKFIKQLLNNERSTINGNTFYFWKYHFSYGVFSFITMIIIIYRTIRKNKFENWYVILAIMLYGLTHNGIRQSLFWILITIQLFNINKKIGSENKND